MAQSIQLVHVIPTSQDTAVAVWSNGTHDELGPSPDLPESLDNVLRDARTKQGFPPTQVRKGDPCQTAYSA